MQICSVKVRNLLSGKYFQNILYHQTTTNQAQMDELKTICLLGCVFFIFFFFLKKLNLLQIQRF